MLKIKDNVDLIYLINCYGFVHRKLENTNEI